MGFTCYLKLNRIADPVSEDEMENGSVGSQSWVLGATFLKKYYAVFDFEDDLKVGMVRSPYTAKDSAKWWPNI